MTGLVCITSFFTARNKMRGSDAFGFGWSDFVSDPTDPYPSNAVDE